MGDGLAVDSDIISIYYQQYLIEEGDIYDLVEKILINCGMAITEFLENEWYDTCGSQLFDVWFTDNLRDGYIQYVNAYLDRQILRKIHNHFGLPRRGRDVELIKIANVTTFRYILTNDIHLFDPKKKKVSQKEKKRIKNQRKGTLCKYLRQKKINIIVGLPEHCRCDLEEHLSS